MHHHHQQQLMFGAQNPLTWCVQKLNECLVYIASAAAVVEAICDAKSIRGKVGLLSLWCACMCLERRVPGRYVESYTRAGDAHAAPPTLPGTPETYSQDWIALERSRINFSESSPSLYIGLIPFSASNSAQATILSLSLCSVCILGNVIILCFVTCCCCCKSKKKANI